MRKSPKHPKPTRLRVIEGVRGHHKPINKTEPQPQLVTDDAIEPPAHLSPEARDEWQRVVKELVPLKLVSVIDRSALAAYCQAYGRWVQAEEAVKRMADNDPTMKGLMVKTKSDNVIQNPLVGTANRAMEIMMKAAMEFGMTPSSRARISIGEPLADDPLERLKRLTLVK